MRDFTTGVNPFGALATSTDSMGSGGSESTPSSNPEAIPVR